ncbi:MAG: hypothetical protein GYA24_06390 [Candidatus Lokiarchaeota archaeon]|nr:hypothetical protein [Candidatus Lokiarchaeota archaeon]
MLLQEEIAPVPDWHDINLIIRDLRGVLDAIDDGDTNNQKFRPAIARTIAMMREEKTREGQIHMARDLARQLTQFRLKDGGLMGDFECDEPLARLAYMMS